MKYIRITTSSTEGYGETHYHTFPDDATSDSINDYAFDCYAEDAETYAPWDDDEEQYESYLDSWDYCWEEISEESYYARR